jgi:hypothetical protein
MANTKISALPTFTGNSTGVYVVIDNSGLTQSFKTTRETLLGSQIPWSTYTVTWSSQNNPQPVLGNGTITGYYTTVGKTVFVRVKLNWGTTTSGGTSDWRFSLPVNAASPDGVQLSCSMLDNGLAWYQGIVNGTYTGAVDKSSIISQSAGGFNSSEAVTATHPFIWGNTDSLQFSGSYEGV